MSGWRILGAWMLTWLGLLSGCSDQVGVRVGVKPFSEQEILAEILERVVEDRGIATRPAYRCTDTFDCQRALDSGYIDVMVEYTGTALHLLGAPPPSEDISQVEWLDSLYAPMNVRWLAPLGFDNGYVWVMPSATASAAEVETISGLHDWPQPLRLAVPPEYVRRPRDGLLATVERYGLQIDPEPLVEPDPLARYQAVLAGRADVAVGYATDGNHGSLGFTRLRDDLEFFGDYEAVVIVRRDALQREPALADALQTLRDQIEPAQMQAMNAAAAIRGEPAQAVARRFLRDRELLSAPLESSKRVPLRIAVATPEIERAFGTRALAAVRQVFEGRTVALHPDDEPLRAIRRGQARLGLVGAEAFFDLDRRGRLKRNRDIEAVAVLGRRVVHLLAPQGADASVLDGKVGVVRGGAAERVAARLLALSTDGATIQPRRSKEELFADVTSGTLDAALVLAPEGDPDVTEALRGELTLIGVSNWLDAERQFQLPFLRPLRLRADAYPGLSQPVDTLASQVLLVAAAPTVGPNLAGGPAAALPAGSKPLDPEQAQALAEAIGNPEEPDPAVPSAWGLSGQNAMQTPSAHWVDAALNAFVIGFLAWLIFVVIDPRDAASDDAVPEDATADPKAEASSPIAPGEGRRETGDAEPADEVAVVATTKTP